MNVCEPSVAVQVITKAVFWGVSEESENLSSCLVAFNGTLPLVSTLPLTLTDTDNGVEVLGRVIAAALAIFRLLMGVSIRIDLSVETNPSSSAR